MSTEQTLTPAQELRAAASKIREIAEPVVTKDGTDIGAYVAIWMDSIARDMDANPGLPTIGWDESLNIARAINGQVTA